MFGRILNMLHKHSENVWTTIKKWGIMKYLDHLENVGKILQMCESLNMLGKS